MRILVISDIHSNLDAFRAVLADAAPFDGVWSLGDVVGYGPQPNECVALLRELHPVALPGNHDYGVLGRLSLEDFNAEARFANLWTRDQLSSDSLAFLGSIPEISIQGDFTLVHGSPREPIWEYVLSSNVAWAALEDIETPFCLVGHSHQPLIFRQGLLRRTLYVTRPRYGYATKLGRKRQIINPGSVGQPRDGDPRAAYMLLDTEARTTTHRRVSYDIAATQAKMRAAGLPMGLISRLEYGR